MSTSSCAQDPVSQRADLLDLSVLSGCNPRRRALCQALSAGAARPPPHLLVPSRSCVPPAKARGRRACKAGAAALAAQP
eukprot:2061861-Rhodomonas_salina.2